MKILITGASGQIGKHLTSQLTHTAHHFIAPDHQQMDIVDFDKTMELIKYIRPDLIINLAAYTAVDMAEDDFENAFAINQQGAKNVAIAATEINAAIIHLSTDYVFSGEKKTPYIENDIAHPINVYGKSKLEGEVAVAAHNPQHIILRASWVFSLEKENFVTIMLNLAKKQNTISIVNDQIGGPTSADSIAETLITITNKLDTFSSSDWGIYHYSGAPYVSWYEFAETIFQEAKTQNQLMQCPELVAIESRKYPSKAKRPLNSRLDNEKLNKRFGIQPCDWRYKLQQFLKASAASIPTR